MEIGGGVVVESSLAREGGAVFAFSTVKLLFLARVAV